MRNNTSFLGVLLLVHGLFGYTDAVMSVSVMDGDSVTLNTDVTEVQKDIIWKFGNEIIAKINKAGEITYGAGGIFRDRLKLDEQTGSLTITNIRNEHVGLYSVDIKGADANLKTFEVTVHGGVKTVSVKEGESVFLHTGVTEIQGYDLIWKIEDDLIADVNERTKLFRKHDSGDVRFKGRLQMHPQSGSLIISDCETRDSGVYHLQMNSSSHTIERSISVTVSERSGAVSGISGASVGLMVWAVALFLLQKV